MTSQHYFGADARLQLPCWCVLSVVRKVGVPLWCMQRPLVCPTPLLLDAVHLTLPELAPAPESLCWFCGQGYLDQGVCLGGSCSNCNDGGHFNYHPRVCAALWVFYIIVLVKACLMVVKYFFVILMCGFATLDDRVKALTSVLVHQHHGVFLQADDMEAIDNYAVRKKASRATIPAAEQPSYPALGGVDGKYIPAA